MEYERRYCPHCLAELDSGTQRCAACGGDTSRENEPHQLPVGTLLRDRYRIGGCIGEGGFGITYAGWDTVLALKVAVKEYYPTGIVNRYHTHSLEVSCGTGERNSQFADGKRRVLDEARALARFSGDAGIVNVRDTFEANNTAYIVMEFLDGRTLKQVEQENGPLPFDRLYAWLAPVMDSLSRIHRQGLIHRDISPSNLMLLNNNTAKLLDFGTMRAFSVSGENSLSVMLKPGFAPEEQYRSHGAQGPWTDVYAMCASIYRLITGVTPENAMNRVFDDTLQPPSALGARISPSQERAIMRGLSVHAADRFQTMEALRRALSGGDEGEDEERTLYRPKGVGARAVEPAPVYAPDAGAAASRPTRSLSPDREAPPAPSRVNPRSDTPGEAPTPSGDATSGLAAPQPPKSARPDRAKPDRARRPGGGKKRLPLLIAGIVVVAAIAAAVVFFFLRGNVIGQKPYKTYGHIASLNRAAVTEQQIQAIDRDSDITAVSISECELSDSIIQRISDMKRIRTVTIESCTGFTSLDPLARMPALERLDLNAGWGSNSVPPYDLDSLLTTQAPQVTELSLARCRMENGGVFLRCFPALKNITIRDCEGPLEMANAAELHALESLTLNGMEVGDAGFSPLSACNSVKHVSITDTQVEDLAWMSSMQNLIDVTLENCGVTHLGGLENHSELYLVKATGNPIADISGLAGCEALSSLTLTDGSFTDISVLSDCPGLDILNLSGCAVDDLSPLSGCTGMISLNLTGNPVSDLSPLRDCVKIIDLILNDMKLTSLNGCEAMIDLKHLEARNNAIENIDGLVNTTQLINVDLSGNQISDIAPLSKNAAKLEDLFLGNNRIENLSALSDATGIRMLGVEGNGLTSLGVVSGFRDLVFLSAGDNRIQDISPLTDLATLTYLDLGGNEISDISALANHPISDQVLLLQNNRIRDISALSGSVSYRCLSLYGNPIQDYAPLEKLSGTISNVLYAGYVEGTDMTPVGLNSYDTRVVDMPLDRQAPLKDAVKTARSEKGLGSFSQLAFLSEEAANSDMDELRAYAFENRSSLGSGLSIYTLLKK